MEQNENAVAVRDRALGRSWLSLCGGGDTCVGWFSTTMFSSICFEHFIMPPASTYFMDVPSKLTANLDIFGFFSLLALVFIQG